MLSARVFRQTTFAVGVSLGYFFIGLVRGFSSPGIPSILELNPELLPSPNIAAWIGSIPPFGAFWGSLLAAPFNHKFGRRKTLLVAAPIGITAWAIIALSQDWTAMFAGRMMSGLCVGLSLPSTQIYVSECCDTKIRGILGSFPSIAMSLGILFFYVFGSFLSWTWLAWIGVTVTTGFLGVLLSLPESPAWLKSKKRYAEAAESANWLMLSDFQATPGEATDAGDSPKKYKSFELRAFRRRTVLLPLGIGLVLLVVQQLSGIDSVIFFTVEIFKASGSSVNSNVATIIVGLVQLLSNFSSLFIVDRFGRRPLLIASGIIMWLSMASMGFAFQLHHAGNDEFSFLPLLSLIFFMIGFSIGFGSIPFLLMGELFPMKQRGILSSLAGSFNLLIMFCVIVTYHPLEELITTEGTFFSYSALCLVGVLFVVFVVPETKGRSLESITLMFAKKGPPAAGEGERNSGVVVGRDNLGHTINKDEPSVTTRI